MLRYLQQEVGTAAVGGAALRRFCEESVARMDWLQRHGVEFVGALCPYRTSYPTGPYSLYFSGNEKAHPYAAIAEPAPRGHRVMGSGAGSMNMTGNVLWETMFTSAVRMGVRFEFASKVESLLFDSDTGAVQGVRYTSMDPSCREFAKHKALTMKGSRYHQLSVRILANLYDRCAEALWRCKATTKTLVGQSVILAAGGFGMNENMVKGWIPWYKRVSPLGTSGDNGSGIKLGQSAGGAVSHMHRMSAWRLM
ncbi:fumarate reductase succinate dehydrogenase flavoprotein domain protein [Apiospora aurea]|uniref:Fumarate reductase succinate dehydrogenase flavoprotein domain protein n=1 Tax=Apiospora aurea TaxID=335848 RepID=A0ABR1QVK1_9PEZI